MLAWYFQHMEQNDLCWKALIFIALPGMVTCAFISIVYCSRQQICLSILSCCCFPILCVLQPVLSICQYCPCENFGTVWCHCCNRCEDCIFRSLDPKDPQLFDVIFRFWTRLLEDIPLLVLNMMFIWRLQIWSWWNIMSMSSSIFMLLCTFITLPGDFEIIDNDLHICRRAVSNNDIYEDL
jgi:hypothetical protein